MIIKLVCIVEVDACDVGHAGKAFDQWRDEVAATAIDVSDPAWPHVRRSTILYRAYESDVEGGARNVVWADD